MRQTFKKSVILFLSLCIAIESIACGGGGYYMDYDMLFDRNFLFKRGQENESFNLWIYHSDRYDNYDNGFLKYKNTSSWAAYLENVYTADDLERIIYRSTEDPFNKTRELKKMRAKRMLDKDISKKEALFMDFIDYALKVEKIIAATTYDPWEEEQSEPDPEAFTSAIEEAKSTIKQTTDAFMKERYAFQLIKLYRYSEQYAEVEKAYKSYFNNSTSMLSYWAMEHYAGSLVKLDKAYEANYYFIKVYTNCPEKRKSSYLSMKLETAKDFDKTLALCTQPEEKIGLHFIRAMQTKALALEDIKAIVKTSGNHEYARIVMAYEINKLERSLTNDSNEEMKKEEFNLLKAQLDDYIKELIVLNEEILAKDSDDQFWHLSLAYLYFMGKQHTKCTETLNKIQPTSKGLEKQHAIIFIVNYLATRETLTEIDENIIGNKLLFVNDHISSYPVLRDFEVNDYVYDEYNTINGYIFREIYKRQKTKNRFMELIFSGNSINWELYSEYPPDGEDKTRKVIDVAYIDNVLADLQKTPETKLALYAARHYFGMSPYNYEDDFQADFDNCEHYLKEYKATLLMRNPEHLKEAIAIFNELPDKFKNEEIYGDPFAFKVANPNPNYPGEYHYNETHLSKLELLKKMVELNSKKSAALDYYKLGLAYYNMSYYGEQWNAMAYFRSSSTVNGNYSMKVPKALFKKALAIGNLTDEQEAKIYFMLARCEQNEYTQINGEIPGNYSWYGGNNDHLFDNYMRKMKEDGAQTNFEILSKKYKNTRFYEEMVEECKYFEYYEN